MWDRICFEAGLNTLGSVLDYANGSAGKKVEKDFYFAQLSDTHWGFSGPKVNRDAKGTLKKAVKVVNSLKEQPDFMVFYCRPSSRLTPVAISIDLSELEFS